MTTEGVKLPHRYIAEKTKSRSLDRETDEKAPSLRKYKLCKALKTNTEKRSHYVSIQSPFGWGFIR